MSPRLATDRPRPAPAAGALASGLLVAAALPPWGWWPLAFVGVAGWHRSLDAAPRRERFSLGSLFGLGWFAPATLWMFDLTAPGWVVLVLLYTLAYGLVGSVVSGDPERRRLELPALVTVVEVLRWNLPFGGVPIATLAMAEADSPFAPAARLFGSLFLSAIVVVGGVTLADATRRRWTAAAMGTTLVVLGVVGAMVAPRAHRVGTITVAVVQGGGPQNTRADLCANRAVFERHMTASALIDAPVDLVLWPEDVVHPSSDDARTPRCDEPLLGETEAAERLAGLAVRLDAVLVPGYFTRSADGTANENYSLVITPDGEVVDRYDKVRLVPFGEFVPLRGLIESFSDELPGRDVRAGTGPAVMDSPVGRLGIAISWEVFFDGRARDAVGSGGEIILNPTNGSSYWLTILQSQQVASSRLRAIETDRWVLQAAPTGFSAVVDPDGDVLDRSGVSEQRVLRATVERREGRTLAVRWGYTPVLAAALASMVAAHVGAARASALRPRAEGSPVRR